MTASEAVEAKTALQRTKAEGEAYAQGVDDGAARAREEQLGVLVWGLLIGAVLGSGVVAGVHAFL